MHIVVAIQGWLLFFQVLEHLHVFFYWCSFILLPQTSAMVQEHKCFTAVCATTENQNSQHPTCFHAMVLLQLPLLAANHPNRCRHRNGSKNSWMAESPSIVFFANHRDEKTRACDKKHEGKTLLPSVRIIMYKNHKEKKICIYKKPRLDHREPRGRVSKVIVACLHVSWCSPRPPKEWYSLLCWGGRGRWRGGGGADDGWVARGRVGGGRQKVGSI